MRTSSAMMKSWHRRDFLKSHKNNRNARSLCHVGDGRLLFFDGFEVDKTKIGAFHPVPHSTDRAANPLLFGGHFSCTIVISA